MMPGIFPLAPILQGLLNCIGLLTAMSTFDLGVGANFFKYWPLQCSHKDRDRYKGVYDDGPDALRLKRRVALQKLGIMDKAIKPHEVVAPEAIKNWADMDEYERKASTRAMEYFAGMVII